MGERTIGAPQLQGGVHTLTISDAEPGTHLRVVDERGRDVVTVVADHAGNAHLAFVPDEHTLLDGPEALVAILGTGDTLRAGTYEVHDDTRAVPLGPVRVLAVDEHPDPALYEQPLEEGFGYLTVRDGVQLSAMVRFPNADLYGPPPYPTVIEYSGYSPQAADGHDVVETVARQPWVLHGRPGMVGLSYPGISQLYVAATRPPHLAAIAPMSVIDDLWRQQWPGGVYNSGFTRAWLAMRDRQTAVGGQAWDLRRIEAGDQVAADNQRVRTQNFDFEQFGRSMENFRPMLEARRAAELVDRIEVPVYLTGAWQDEQTGSRFALMLDRFESSPHVRFNLFNGHHPDGYSPMVVTRWFGSNRSS